MRMIIPLLSKQELSFLLELLNAADGQIELVGRRMPPISPEDAEHFDEVGERLRKKFEKGKVAEAIRPKGSYFATRAEDRDVRTKGNGWSVARIPLIAAVVELRNRPGNFVHLMIVGVPAHHPPVMINNPIDLVQWLVACAMANGQIKRLVRCKRNGCGKFGMRERAKKDAQFCSKKCQQEFNAFSKKLKAAGVPWGDVPSTASLTAKA